jgi:hypothetical protein
MSRRGGHVNGYPRGASLDRIVEEIKADHLMRLDVADHVPLVRRGPRKRKRPNTALIWEACAQKQAEREMRESLQKKRGNAA